MKKELENKELMSEELDEVLEKKKEKLFSLINEEL